MDHLGGANRGNGTFNFLYAYLDSSWFYTATLSGTLTYSCVCDPSVTVAHTSWQWLFIWNRARRSLAGDLNLDMHVDHLGGANRGNGTFNFLYAYLDSSWFYTWYWFSYFFSSVAVIGLRHISSTRFVVFDRSKLPLSEDATNLVLVLSRKYLGGANRGDGNHKI